MEYCYTSVTQMLQCCYKKRRNNSVMQLKRFCNIIVHEKKTAAILGLSRKNCIFAEEISNNLKT